MILTRLLSFVALAASVTLTSAISISSTSSVDLAIDIEGSEFINGVSFQQNVISTFGDYQYVVFYNTTSLGYGHHYVNVGRRKVTPSVTKWEILTLSDYEQTTLDGHNVISLGISGDGKIHLSFDHHDVPLNYRVSTAAIAKTIPTSWTASLFGPVVHSLPGSTGPWTPLTYPRFKTLSGGDMLMEFRIGQSGSGDSYLHRYSTATGQWSAVGKYLQGEDNNAYINGVDSVNGRLFVSWVVRETPDPVTNHDFYFAYSDDNGVSWKNSAGAAVTKPITPSTSGIKIYDIPQNKDLVNQEGQFTDSQGRFHALQRDSTSGVGRYYHFMRTTAGVWTKDPITPSGLSAPPLLGKRGKIALDASGKNMVALLPDDLKGQVGIYGSTEQGSFKDWALLTIIPKTACEPLFDPVRLQESDTLSVFIRQNGSYPSRKLQVWDFKLKF
ncbi:hypothetical protein PVAG01_03431 [Phlyctema vagabunda]|uniref:Uncharacterized protein n=1 Tax=Phlyctema vagabunda TaxID=108571 RepID=A0ABR4PLE7_9HELO